MENSNNTTSTTKVVEQDGNEVSLKIIKPDRPDCTHVLLPVFIFILSEQGSIRAATCPEELAYRIVAESPRISAVLLTNQCAVFDYFAALKWIFCNGEEAGLDVTRIAIVGYQRGANVAAVMSLMAFHDELPKICLQVLIDPQFYNKSYETLCSPQVSLVPDKNVQDWLNKDGIHNLPLELVEGELAGMPPTSLLFSDKSRISYEVEHYCIKLLRVGKSVNYLVGDRAPEINHEKDFLSYAVAQLTYFLLPDVE